MCNGAAPGAAPSTGGGGVGTQGYDALTTAQKLEVTNKKLAGLNKLSFSGVFDPRQEAAKVDVNTQKIELMRLQTLVDKEQATLNNSAVSAANDAKLAEKDQKIAMYEKQQADTFGTNQDVANGTSPANEIAKKRQEQERYQQADDQETRVLLSGTGSEEEQRSRRLNAQAKKRSVLGG